MNVLLCTRSTHLETFIAFYILLNIIFIKTVRFRLFKKFVLFAVFMEFRTIPLSKYFAQQHKLEKYRCLTTKSKLIHHH